LEATVRYISFTDSSGKPGAGVLDGDLVRPFRAGVASLDAFIALDEAARAREIAAAGTPIPLASVTLRSPVRPHKNIFCVGRNYLAHAAEGARALGKELSLPDVPTFFTKAPTAISDPGATLHLDPKLSPQYDFEAELAIVIGRRCKDVSREDALDVIFGYTCLNDVTARDLQRAHLQWFKGKSLDETCPIGPWIVDAAEVGDPQNLTVKMRVNGVEKQNASTSTMIFDVRTVIESLSRGLTLEPGDVIATGTPEGVGFARVPPEFLQDGDVMEVDIERIGVLRNGVALAVHARAR
jgi:2-keto-4-pentenoate hydratase/2-oxohepta-3-ene-1,7-dioic acid hydratase in catechol pathway